MASRSLRQKIGRDPGLLMSAPTALLPAGDIGAETRGRTKSNPLPGSNPWRVTVGPALRNGDYPDCGSLRVVGRMAIASGFERLKAPLPALRPSKTESPDDGNSGCTRFEPQR
jgi:hypothetical protein